MKIERGHFINVIVNHNFKYEETPKLSHETGRATQKIIKPPFPARLYRLEQEQHFGQSGSVIEALPIKIACLKYPTIYPVKPQKKLLKQQRKFTSTIQSQTNA